MAPNSVSSYHQLLLPFGLIVFFGLILAWFASQGSLIGDEAFYAGVGLESYRSGQLYPLQVNGRDYVLKPPLSIWLQIASLKLLGLETFPARLPSVMFGATALSVLATTAYRLLGLQGAIAASLLLLASPNALGITGNHGLSNGTGDAALLFTIVLAITALAPGAAASPVSSHSKLFFAATLSAWTKGAVGPLALTLLLLAWAMLRGRIALSLRHHLPTIPVSLLAIVTSWLSYACWLLSLSASGADRVLSRAIGKEVVQRIAGTLNSDHIAGPSFYLDTLFHEPLVLLSVLASVSLICFGRTPHNVTSVERILTRTLSIYAILWFFLVSLSASKQTWYTLPAYPALAVSLGHLFSYRGPTTFANRFRFFLATIFLLALSYHTHVLLRSQRQVHPLEDQLLRLKQNGHKITWIDPSLRFGRFGGQLDSTEYFLVEALRLQLDQQAEARAPISNGLQLLRFPTRIPNAFTPADITVLWTNSQAGRDTCLALVHARFDGAHTPTSSPQHSLLVQCR